MPTLERKRRTVDSGQQSKAMPKPRKEPDKSRYSGRIAARLRAMRDEREWTVAELTARIRKVGYSVNPPTVYAWENGRLQINPDALPYVARCFGLSIREFLPEK